MAYLVLNNGKVFEGKRIGAPVDRMGELVFTTGVVGYLETLTDPSYYGQMVVQTFPLIGNYGVIEEDFEGRSALFGYIVRELCDTPSNFRSQYDVNTYLKQHGIPGLCGVDTREITRITREEGVMNALICDQVPDDLSMLHAFQAKNAVLSVTRTEKTVYPSLSPMRKKVVLMDFGAKRNIIRSLRNLGCEVTAVPARTSAEEILSLSPDGVMLSNGPGDPKDNPEIIREVRKLLGKVPLFGICLGHQLVALALGGDTVKLKYGHRGGNQPVRDLTSGKTWITSQNHGYAVLADTLQGKGRQTFVNANDQSCEGMDYPDFRAFTVQFHPEACSGPKDAGFLFARFMELMEGNAYAQG